MTTPAINIDATQRLALPGGYHRRVSSCDNTYFTYPTVADAQIRKLIVRKPVSVSTRPWTSKWKPPTSWSREYFYLEGPQGYYQIDGVVSCPGPDGYSITRHTLQWTLPASNPSTYWPYSASLLSRNTTDLLGKLKDNQSINLGQAFAERKQTEGLLINAMDRIGDTVRSFRAARKGDWNKIKRINRQRQSILASGRQLTQREAQLLRFPNAWLEVQYGWNPLMSDVYGAMHAVDVNQRNRAYVLKCDKSSKSIYPYRFAVNSNWSASAKMAAPVGSTTTEYCKQVVYYTLASQNLSTLASLGLTNPVNLAWELVPFSFVVDWFLPLGDWFNSFDATLGKDFKSGTRTRVVSYPRVQCRVSQVGSLPGPAYSVHDSSAPGTGFVEYFRMNRDVLANFPSPTPPAFKNPCSPSHVASALSLMASAFGRSVRPYVRS